MNHTTGRVAIGSRRLKSRLADVEAATGLTVAGSGPVILLATAEGDPDFARAEARARRAGVPLAVFAPGPLVIRAFESAGRPLCYRVTGMGPTVDGSPRTPSKAAVAALAARAEPGEIRLEAGFDPADPSIVWLCPYTRRRISAERAIDIAGDALRHSARTARRSYAVGVTAWKRSAVSAFLDGSCGKVAFADVGRAVSGAKATGGRVVVWASRRTDVVERAAAAAAAPLARIEDGFLRSVGLGSAFVRPVSLVLDESGIYYDPSAPSDLETLLREADLDERLVARAAGLRRRIVEAGATKYNLGGGSAGRVVPEGRLGVLVPGQVEGDASILRGGGAVRANRALVEAVRARRPDAFIVYKPHPDVAAGYRKGLTADPVIARIADAVVTDGSIADLYPQCAALETMTSLSGFEALLRGLEVTTHGQPFYAGWGLTEDLAPPSPRRGRARSLDELVAATLILYPVYVDPVTGLPCGPETALDRILAARDAASGGKGRFAARLRHAYALTRHRLLGPFARGRL